MTSPASPELDPQTAAFLVELKAAQETDEGKLPLTIRHIAHRIVPVHLQETIVEREYRVFRAMQCLVAAGILEDCTGLMSRVYDGPDPLPTFAFRDQAG